MRGDQGLNAIADKTVTVPALTKNTLHAKYVDDFMYVSHDPRIADQECSSMTEALNSEGLIVHECFSACTSCTFAGIDFDGILHTAELHGAECGVLHLLSDTCCLHRLSQAKPLSVSLATSLGPP